MTVKYPNFDGTQACANADVEDFYYEDYEGTGQRKSKSKKDFTTAAILCSSCPFKDPCFVYALHHEEYGFWGGYTEEERKKIRKEKGIKFENPLAYTYRVRLQQGIKKGNKLLEREKHICDSEEEYEEECSDCDSVAESEHEYWLMQEYKERKAGIW